MLDKENHPQANRLNSTSLWETMREDDKLKEQLAHGHKLRVRAELEAGLGSSTETTSIQPNQQLEQLVQENECLRSQCTSLLESLDKANQHKEAMVVEVQRAAQVEVQQQFADFQGALETAKKHTLRNERRVKALQKNCTEELLDLRDIAKTRILASRVVHNAVIHGLVTSMARKQDEAAQATLDQREHLQKLYKPSVKPFNVSAALETSLDNIQRLRSHLNEQGSEYSHSLAAKDSEIFLLRQELHKAHEHARSARAETAEVLRALDTACAEVRQTRHNLEEQVSKHTESLANKEAEVSFLARELQKSLQDSACLKMESAQLYRSVEAAHEQARCTQIHLEQHASIYSNNLSAREAQVCALTRDLHKAHRQVSSLTDDRAMLQNMLEERRKCKPGGAQDVHERNRQLLHTVEQFTQDCHMLEATNRSLRESVKAFEESFEGVAEQDPQNIVCWHIQHATQLRKENLQLKDEVWTIKNQRWRSESTLLETLPSLSCLLEADTPQQRSFTSEEDEDMSSVSLLQSTPQRLEIVRTKLCRQADMVLEGVIQDFCHAKLLMERATAHCDDGRCQDFGGLLSRLRRVDTDRCKCNMVNGNVY